MVVKSTEGREHEWPLVPKYVGHACEKLKMEDLSDNDTTASLSTTVSRRSRSTTNPGHRLYSYAIEKEKKLQILRKKSSSFESSQKPRLSSKSALPISKTKASQYSQETAKSKVDDYPRSNRLYALSKNKQDIGKKRREAIARASFQRNSIPDPDTFGKIPPSKAQNMYQKGIKMLREKESRIAVEKERKNRIDQLKLECAKIPISEADKMYLKGLRVLREKEQRLLDLNDEKIEFGKLKLEDADKMYNKGLRTLAERDIKIAEKQKTILDDQLKKHRFKLAEGAFALTPEFKPKTFDLDSPGIVASLFISSNERKSSHRKHFDEHSEKDDDSSEIVGTKQVRFNDDS